MSYIKDFNELSKNDISLVGGKNASLGEMINNLSRLNIQIPDGFAITTDAYEYFINHNNLQSSIVSLIDSINEDDLINLRRISQEIRRLIYNGSFPRELENIIVQKYKSLSRNYFDSNNKPQNYTDVAVRSSSTAEDLPDASFAGQQDTFLNIRTEQDLLDSIKKCFASLFNYRAISYRKTQNYDHKKVSISVGIQKMVRSDLGSSGVAFSLDPESGFKNIVLINGSFGLGELVVGGQVKPDEFIVFKETNKIIEKKLGNKNKKMVYGNIRSTKIINIDSKTRNQFCLDDENIELLANWVKQIEEYYKYPVDVEWAFDGLSKKLFIVQARPETVISKRNTEKFITYKLKDKSNILIKGIAVGDLISSGKVKIINSLDTRDNEYEFNKGDILVTDITDPDWEPLMKISSGIITNKGGRTSHASIVARELGIPAIVGCLNATDIFEDKQEITMSCAEGEIGYVFEGLLMFEKKEEDLSKLPKIKTKIMLNVASPDKAFKYAQLPHSGVGLAREELIINNYIKVHPNALLNHKQLNDIELTKSINKLIIGYNDEYDYYIKKLSYGVAKIATAFYPQDVIVRFSDFKSNEYRNLLGGKYFEPHEENPMIGWRGASRYYHPDFERAFGMECEAIKIVREYMGLTNVIVMVPFCRTPEEMIKVQKVMKKYGLERGKNDLQVYVMCEIPSNVILAEEFCKLVDGFSIGSNDLTQLTLGLDRDSELVADIFNERNEAVKTMISMVIKTCHKNNTKIGICGQGPSDFPEFAKFLVEEKIDSISLVPDSVVKTIKSIAYFD